MKIRLSLIAIQKIDDLIYEAKKEILAGFLQCFEDEEGFNDVTFDDIKRNVIDGFAEVVNL